MSQVNPIPQGYHTITAYLCIDKAAEAIEFYKKAFGAVENMRSSMPGDDRIMHADMQIGDSRFMISEDFGMPMGPASPNRIGGTTFTVHLYIDNVDALWQQAVGAGCEVVMPLGDQFWGDRWGLLKDPYGHHWGLATHIADPTPEEMQAAAAEMFKDGGCG